QLALAAAEDSAPEAEIIECMAGLNHVLFDLGRTLASESAHGYPEGPLFWNDAATSFIHEVVARHTSAPEPRSGGTLEKDVIKRIRSYVLEHLDGPISVANLADIAGKSTFHFSRLFTRSVGVSPHRYIVHVRLRRASELIRDGRSSLAEIAVRTG